MICSSECKFCKLETVGQGDVSYQCVLAEYYALLEAYVIKDGNKLVKEYDIKER